jgi:hypothetical protein
MVLSAAVFSTPLLSLVPTPHVPPSSTPSSPFCPLLDPPAENNTPSGQGGEPRARTYHQTNTKGIHYDVQKSLGSPPAERRQWKTRVRAEHFFN